MPGEDDTPPPPPNPSVIVSGVPGIEKLEGRSNYASWKIAMRYFLGDCGLWKAVLGEDKDPTRMERAMCKIGMAIKPVCHPRLHGITCPKAAWAKLAKDYGEQGIAGQLMLERKLYRTLRDDFRSMDEYISYMMSVRTELSESGVEVADEKLGSLLLHGLPESYTQLILSYGAANKKVTLESVLEFLHTLDEGASARQSETALSAKASPSNSKSNPTCYHCQKIGHKKPDCPDLKKAKKAQKKEKIEAGKPNSLQAHQSASSSGSSKKVGLLTVALASASLGKEDWYFDSCCSRPVSHRSDLADSVNFGESQEILVADNSVMKSNGIGNITLEINNKGMTKAEITDVLLCPNSAANLLSVHQIAQKGNVLVFDKNGVNVFSQDSVKIEGESVLTGSAVNGIYKLDRDGKSTATQYGSLSNVALISCNSQELWHKRMGHLNVQSLCKLRKLANGIVFSPSEKDVCVPCVKGKHSKLPFQKPATRAKAILELVHSDICVPERGLVSYGGATCFVTFTDDFSRMSFVYFLKTKGECFAKFKEFKAEVENQMDTKIKRLRCDNGGEYVSHEFKNFCANNGIALEYTIPHTPEQNGVSERLNRTCVERARSMLFQAKLDKKYWAEAVNTSIYLKNRSPTVALDNQLPLEVWTGCKVDLSNIRVFGCKAMSQIPKVKRKKFDPKSEELILVGYCDRTQGYRLADPKEPGIVSVSRNVIFDENRLGCMLDGNAVVPMFDELSPEWIVCETSVDTPAIPVNEPVPVNVPVNVPVDEPANDVILSDNEDDNAVEANEAPVEDGRVQRDKRPPRWHDDYEMYLCVALSAVESVPDSPIEALKDPDWKCAMEREYNALLKNNVWDLIDRPEGCNVVKSKWVFKVKKDTSGNYSCHKARLVARGYSQKQGVDYMETYSPVVRAETLRLIMSIANELSYDMEHVDITTAFLNGDLSETIYMEQPAGFVVPGKVCALKKSLYGLKQASRAWNENIKDLFKELGYTQSVCDPCVFVKKESACAIYICLYVDDIFVFTNWADEKQKLYKCLSKKYAVKFLGQLENCLGMKVDYSKERGVLKLSQSEYVSDVLEKFNMKDCYPKCTPMSAGRVLSKSEAKDDKIPYQNLVGSLMYLAISTRPDIMYSVSKLSQYNSCYDENHWVTCKRVLRYLSGTKEYGLVFTRSGNLNVECYVDASYAVDMENGYSQIGYVMKLGGSVFAWQSKQLKTVTLSSTESEYLGLTEGIKQSMYVRNVLEILGLGKVTVNVFNDNNGAMCIARDEQCHKRTKHINIRDLFIKEKVREGFVKLNHLGTNDLVADIMTKALPKDKHVKFVKMLCLQEV